jgi:hypothetical protein
MKLREIQSELKQRSVSYDDCFDRNSLTKRLIEARENNPIKTSDEAPTYSGTKDPPTAESESPQSSPTAQVKVNDESSEFDREATLTELRTQRVKYLREQLSQCNVRWGNMIEKEELVQALCTAMEQRFLRSQNFSRSGVLVAGEVFDSNEDVLTKELGWANSDLNRGIITPAPDSSNPTSHAPLLLDVYATWYENLSVLLVLLLSLYFSFFTFISKVWAVSIHGSSFQRGSKRIWSWSQSR